MMPSWVCPAAALLASLMLAMAPAFAQVSALPPSAAEAFRAFGPVMTGELLRATVAALAPLQPLRKPAAVIEALDVPYGPDPSQRLDIYAPATPGEGRPVLVFVPGGGFTGTGRRNAGSFFLQNIGYAGASQGMVAAVMGYRVAPQHSYPAGAQDVAYAIAWLRQAAGAYGGNPQRIILMGHSAGAAHVADTVALGLAPGIAGAILVSGIYDPAATDDPGAALYYGAGPALRAARSPLSRLAASPLPMLLAMAELDPPGLAAQTQALHEALCAQPGRCPKLLRLAGHNHVSEILSIGTADRELSAAMAAFAHQQHLTRSPP